MRKILMIFLTVILVIILYMFLGVGLDLSVIEIPSFAVVTENNQKLNDEISKASKESTTGIEDRKKELKEEYKNYLNAKNEYTELKQTEETKEPSESASEIYNIEYLWTTIGNFATQNGIKLDFGVTESTAITSETEGNVICDLNFKCIGDYENITNFIKDLEENEARFSFVPENLKIVVYENPESSESSEKSEEEIELTTDLIATFKKTGVILNKDSISEFVTSTEEETAGEETTASET